MNKILRYSFIAVLAFICNFAFADTYTYTFESKQFSKTNETKNLNGIDWTVSTDATYFGFDTSNYKKGQQFGSKKSAATTLTLSTKDIPGKISSIKINTAGASGIQATLDVTVGGKKFGEQYALTLDKADATFTGNEEGEIKLSYKNSSKVAIYILSIEVVTDGKIVSKPEETKTAANIAEFKALSTGTKAILTLKDAKVQYVNGTNDIYVVDATGGIDIYKSNLTYTAGQILNGTIEATYDEYNKLPELTNITENNLTATDGAIKPIEMTVEEAAKAENVCKLVTVKNIKLVETNNNYYNDEAKTLQIYDKFKLDYTPNTESAMDYTGILIPYNSQIELAPTVEPTATATSISNITTDAASANAPVYNLAGQKVSASYKGVVVKAGKKYIQK